MKKRFEINAADLDNIVGGAITWKANGECYDKDHPETVYHFNVSDFLGFDTRRLYDGYIDFKLEDIAKIRILPR